MKALILAAGYATRLYPLTETIPKPLLKVGDKTILGHIITKLNNIPTIDQIFIVTNNHFYPQFNEWISTNPQENITLVNDNTNSNEDRLGSIGDMEFVVQKYTLTDDLLVIGGDNLFEDNLTDFISFFEQNGSSILLHDVQDIELAKNFGIVSLNQENKLIDFEEKPENPQSTLASTLVYGLTQNHLHLFSKALEENKWDSPGNFIKFLSQRENVYGKIINGNWFDIGSIDQLQAARNYYETQRI